MKAAFAMRRGLPQYFFSPAQIERLGAIVEIDIDRTWQSFDEASAVELAEVEILITGWKAPRIDDTWLAAMPRLRAIVHTAGSVKFHLAPAVWDRGVLVTSAAWANAIPVAEFTLAMILLAGKRVLPISRQYTRTGGYPDLPLEYPRSGNFGTTIGLIGASLIGRRVIELLRPFDMSIIVADPYLNAFDAAQLGVESVPLAELMARADVVSLHAPDLPSTRRMLGASEFARMKTGATFLNTARPALVDQDALLAELRSGRLNAVLDVTGPEPLGADHELFQLSNVTISPHVAGAHGNELFRLGASALDEVERIAAGRNPAHPVTFAALATMA